MVVCAHSYGGAPVTEALTGEGKVRRLVYLCAWQLDVGESLLGARHGTPPQWWDVHEAEGYIDPLRPREIFYGDLEQVTADTSIARLGHQSLAAVSQPLTQASWNKIPEVGSSTGKIDRLVFENERRLLEPGSIPPKICVVSPAE